MGLGQLLNDRKTPVRKHTHTHTHTKFNRGGGKTNLLFGVFGSRRTITSAAIEPVDLKARRVAGDHPQLQAVAVLGHWLERILPGAPSRGATSILEADLVLTSVGPTKVARQFFHKCAQLVVTDIPNHGSLFGLAEIEDARAHEKAEALFGCEWL